MVPTAEVVGITISINSHGIHIISSPLTLFTSISWPAEIILFGHQVLPSNVGYYGVLTESNQNDVEYFFLNLSHYSLIIVSKKKS